MCETNSVTQVCGGRQIAEILNGRGTQTQVRWCSPIRRIVDRFLAHYKLWPSDFRSKTTLTSDGRHVRIFDLLRQGMGCSYPQDPFYDEAVRPKIESMIEHRFKTLDKHDVIILYNTPGGHRRAYWPDYTNRWAADDWDGAFGGRVDPRMRLQWARVAQGHPEPGYAALPAAVPQDLAVPQVRLLRPMQPMRPLQAQTQPQTRTQTYPREPSPFQRTWPTVDESGSSTDWESSTAPSISTTSTATTFGQDPSLQDEDVGELLFRVANLAVSSTGASQAISREQISNALQQIRGQRVGASTRNDPRRHEADASLIDRSLPRPGSAMLAGDPRAAPAGQHAANSHAVHSCGTGQHGPLQNGWPLPSSRQTGDIGGISGSSAMSSSAKRRQRRKNAQARQQGHDVFF